MKEQLKLIHCNEPIIAAIPTTMIDLIWPKVLPWLEKPIDLSHDEVDISALKNHLKQGNHLLCTISIDTDIIGVFTLEVRTFDTGLRAMYIPLVAGKDIHKWIDRGFKVIEAIAKDYNCTELRGISVRKGWMRMLKDRGWEEVSTTVRCPIGGE